MRDTPASGALQVTVSSLVDFVRRNDDVPRSGSRWGTCEVLAHLVYWHERYVECLDAAREGREVALPRATLKDLNARAVVDLSGIDSQSLASRLAVAQDRLDRLVAAGVPADATIQLAAGTRAWPWRELLDRAARHVAGHERDLRRAGG